MNVLLLGSGGREHALAWKIAQSPLLGKLFAAPGNPGIAQHAELASLDPADHRAVVDFCHRHSIGLVVIGPEAPLVDGLGDNLRRMGFLVFGPNQYPAQLEGSKGFTKDLCAQHGIPTARYVRASDRLAAEAAVAGFGYPVVVKADGLAAGKGVVIADDEPAALAAVAAIFASGAGAAAVIEEYMSGEEVSFFVLTDGVTIVPFGSAQDHKRVGEGDTGPNTGGMGAYSPASIFTAALERRVLADIVAPTLRALADAGHPYSGILYAGLMLTPDGPKLVEYNARFGDPECQVLMMRLDSDLLPLLLASARGTLAAAAPPRFADEVALTVVMAAKGYPGPPTTGGGVALPAPVDGVEIFQAGAALADGVLVASGGRVLAVTARAATIAKARDAAYAAIGAVDFPAGFYRRDIGWREIARRRS